MAHRPLLKFYDFYLFLLNLGKYYYFHPKLRLLIHRFCLSYRKLFIYLQLAQVFYFAVLLKKFTKQKALVF